MNIRPWFTFLLMLVSINPVLAQDARLTKQLQQSSYLKYTMKADSSDAGLTRWLKKRVEKSRILPLATDFNALQTKGPGTIKIDHEKTISGNGSVLLITPTS